MSRCREFYLKWKQEENFCDSQMVCDINSHIAYMDSFFPEWLESEESYRHSAIAEYAVRMLIPVQFEPFHDSVLDDIRNIQKFKNRKIDTRLIRKLIDKHRPRPEIPKLPDGKFNLIYGDPPWQYDFSETNSRKIENQYSTLTIDEIKELQDKTGRFIHDVAAEEAVLFLWGTAPKLREALDVMSAWGFEYKTHAIWDKEIIGMGYWFRGQHELLLVGTRGNFSPPEGELRISSVIKERRTDHSKKPDYFYKIIERMFPDAKYLELFAREQREGWASWGDEL